MERACYKNALQDFEEAAALGHIFSAICAGEFYFKGLGTPRPDPEKAEFYLKRIKPFGKQPICLDLNKLKMLATTYIINRKFDEAIDVLQLDLFADDAQILYRLYEIYKNFKYDNQRAFFYLKKAYRLNYPPVYYQLYLLYLNEEISAFDFLVSTGEIKIRQACFFSEIDEGIQVENALELEQHAKEMMCTRCLRKGFFLKDLNCMHALAYMYNTGTFVKKDFSKSLELFKKLVNCNHYETLMILGSFYENGTNGFMKDLRISGILFYKARQVSQYQSPNWKNASMRFLDVKEKFEKITESPIFDEDFQPLEKNTLFSRQNLFPDKNFPSDIDENKLF